MAEADNSHDVVNFDVKWMPEINEIAVRVTHFSGEGGQATEETCLLFPKAIATELRWALDRALNASRAA